MDITEAYESYKNALSDLNAAVEVMLISADHFPVGSVDSAVKNFGTRYKLIVSASKNLTRSLNSMTYKMRELERDIRKADASLVLMGMSAGLPMQPDAGVSAAADDATGEQNKAALQALIGSDPNKAASEEKEMEIENNNMDDQPEEVEMNNMVEFEEMETNNMAEFEEMEVNNMVEHEEMEENNRAESAESIAQ